MQIVRSILSQIRTWFGAVNVRQYGAVGNGTTDDTIAIRAAITAAGVNGTVIFPSGKTFLVSGALTPLTGQTWVGYGAIIKRAAQVSSATATAITTGSNQSVTVTNGALFTVGQDVTVYNGASYDPHNHRITAIVGNVLSLGTFFTVAFPSGGTVITAVTPIQSTATDVSIFGLEIDGNQTNNATLQKWDLNAEIYLGGCDRGIVRDCYIHDAQSEGIEVGGVSVTVENCYVLNTQGNGIHLSGSTHGKVTNCYVKNCNLAGTGPGHADGCIIASNGVGDTIITGNYVENGIAGIGSWDSDDDSSLICTGNVVRNCTSYAFEGICPNGTTVGNLDISHNKFFNSGTFTLNYTGSFAVDTGPYRNSICNNLFDSTAVSIGPVFGLIFDENIFIGASATTGNLAYFTNCVGVQIHNNRLRSGQYGIYIDSANGRDISIMGNHCKEQYTTGIRFNNAGAGTGYSVRGNTIVASSAVSASYNAIVATNNVRVDANEIDVQVAGTAGCILCPNGGTNINGAFVTNNTIRSVSGQPSIKAAGGSQNNIITGNLIQQAISNSGGGAQPNTVSGNTTIY